MGFKQVSPSQTTVFVSLVPKAIEKFNVDNMRLYIGNDRFPLRPYEEKEFNDEVKLDMDITSSDEEKEEVGEKYKEIDTIVSIKEEDEDRNRTTN